MKTRILLLIIAMLCGQFAYSQIQKKKDSFRSVSLNKLAYEANYGSSSNYKLKGVVLSGFKDPQDDWNPRERNWLYVFHLKDERSGFELGKELTPYTSYFLICTDESIGKPLTKQKDEWLNQKVNVYLQPRDFGLTPFMNVAFVTKIELLDAKGKVIKTIE